HHHEVGEAEQEGRAPEQASAERRAILAGQAHCASTSAFIDRPTRSGCCCSSLGSSAILTGTRCTTLIQLPVAFCAGIRAKAEPEPPEKPTTLPWNFTPRP